MTPDNRPPQMGTCRESPESPHTRTSYCVNWQPVAPEKEARPHEFKPKPQTDELAQTSPEMPCGGSSSAGDAVPRTPPDCDLCKVEDFYEQCKFDFTTNRPIGEIMRFAQAYASSVTAHKDAEIANWQTGMNNLEEEVAKLLERQYDLQAELDRRDKEIAELRDYFLKRAAENEKRSESPNYEQRWHAAKADTYKQCAEKLGSMGGAKKP